MPANFLTNYPQSKSHIRRERGDGALRYIVSNPMVNAAPEAPNTIKLNDGGATGAQPEAIIRVLLDHSIAANSTITTDLVSYQDCLINALALAQKTQES